MGKFFDYRRYDNLVGFTCGKVVLAGECALSRCGLVYTESDSLRVYTLHQVPPGLTNAVAIWYFSPYADKYFDTNPSPRNSSILEPTQERALIESIMFQEYFTPDLIEEAMRTYKEQHSGNWSALFTEGDKFNLPVDALTYWINKAEMSEDN